MNDGGPAFPVLTEYGQYLEVVNTASGMSLRDYFAAKFAAAWVVALSRRWQEPTCADTDILHEANRRGLEQADAMLAARQSEPQHGGQK